MITTFIQGVQYRIAFTHIGLPFPEVGIAKNTKLEQRQ
jgi:hypothetical protein